MQHIPSMWHNATAILKARTEDAAVKKKDKTPVFMGLTF